MNGENNATQDGDYVISTGFMEAGNFPSEESQEMQQQSAQQLEGQQQDAQSDTMVADQGQQNINPSEQGDGVQGPEDDEIPKVAIWGEDPVSGEFVEQDVNYEEVVEKVLGFDQLQEQYNARQDFINYAEPVLQQLNGSKLGQWFLGELQNGKNDSEMMHALWNSWSNNPNMNQQLGQQNNVMDDDGSEPDPHIQKVMQELNSVKQQLAESTQHQQRTQQEIYNTQVTQHNQNLMRQALGKYGWNEGDLGAAEKNKIHQVFLKYYPGKDTAAEMMQPSQINGVIKQALGKKGARPAQTERRLPPMFKSKKQSGQQQAPPMPVQQAQAPPQAMPRRTDGVINQAAAPNIMPGGQTTQTVNPNTRKDQGLYARTGVTTQQRADSFNELFG